MAPLTSAQAGLQYCQTDHLDPLQPEVPTQGCMRVGGRRGEGEGEGKGGSEWRGGHGKLIWINRSNITSAMVTLPAHLHPTLVPSVENLSKKCLFLSHTTPFYTSYLRTVPPCCLLLLPSLPAGNIQRCARQMS